MAKTELDHLTLADLKKLQKDIAKAIQTYDSRQKQTVLSALEEKAKEFGTTLSELFSDAVGAVGKRLKGKPVRLAAKYANPADATKTWSGRGRQPKWFKDALAAGKAPESMAI